MKKQESIFIGIYALLNLVGGFIGYFMANSKASLIASSIVASLLLICILLIQVKEMMRAYDFAMMIICSLCLFFSYRFFITHQFMPAGLMSIISGALFIYLASQRNVYSVLCSKK